MSTFGNTADIYAIVHFVPHACQPTRATVAVSPSGKSGQLCARAFPLKKTSTISVSIDVRITMICCVVHFLRILEMFYGLMNNPVCIQIRCRSCKAL